MFSIFMWTSAFRMEKGRSLLLGPFKFLDEHSRPIMKEAENRMCGCDRQDENENESTLAIKK